MYHIQQELCILWSQGTIHPGTSMARFRDLCGEHGSFAEYSRLSIAEMDHAALEHS